MVVGTLLGGVNAQAALVLGFLVDQHGGDVLILVQGILGLEDADRAGLLALVLRRLLGVDQRVLHVAALLVDMVILAAQSAVIGGGAAGMLSAYTASNQGKKVILIEKNEYFEY